MAKDKNITWRRVENTKLVLEDWKVGVVGGTGGLGRSIGRALASRGAAVTVVGQTFRDQGAGIDFLKADLSLMREAERVARELPAEQLDLVVLTTGIFAAPARQETAEGIERDMAVSYLSRLVGLITEGTRGFHLPGSYCWALVCRPIDNVRPPGSEVRKSTHAIPLATFFSRGGSHRE